MHTDVLIVLIVTLLQVESENAPFLLRAFSESPIAIRTAIALHRRLTWARTLLTKELFPLRFA